MGGARASSGSTTKYTSETEPFLGKQQLLGEEESSAIKDLVFFPSEDDASIIKKAGMMMSTTPM